jgi:hypothetical protein
MLSTGLFIVGAILFLAGIYQRMKLAASMSWPSAPATIVDAHIKEEAAGTGGESTTMYAPVISYQYDVKGTSYTGSRLSFGRVSYSTQRQAQKRLEQYPKGGQIAVYYNPDKPGDCVLERTSTLSLILIGIGAGLALVSFLLLMA